MGSSLRIVKDKKDNLVGIVEKIDLQDFEVNLE